MEYRSVGKEQGLECWSNRLLGLKAEIGPIFTLLTLVMRNPNKVYIFPLYQPLSIHYSLRAGSHHSNIPALQHSNTPALQYSNTPGTINLLL
jgi:hypothetical protein